jgi:hypothetical protein
MRKILAFLLALSCMAACGPVNADADSDFQLARRQYIQRASFVFRQNVDLRLVRSPDAEATVQLRFAPDGKFLTLQFDERSGVQAFDTAVEIAIRRSITSLPPPPIPPGASEPFAISVRICVAC